LLLVQAMIGIGVNLYIKVPGAAHSIGDAISKGPAALALHVVLGLLLVVAAVAWWSKLRSPAIGSSSHRRSSA